MAKTIRHDMRYDAPLEQVAAMLADPEHRERVCRAQGMARVEVDITTGGDGTRVHLDQHQSADGLPSFARKIVGGEVHIVQEEHWTSPDHADVRLTIPGKPGQMVGTARLQSVPEGTVATVELTVTVNIPLVGGKIEGLIADKLVRALTAEHRVGREYLAAR